MTEASLGVLLASAASIGIIHTAIGPDHYLPFIVLGKAEGWTLRKTLFWTAVCGVGHVLSSVVLGAIGIALGWAVGGMEAFEGYRGDIAAYALLGFGALYGIWGLWRGRRGHRHAHIHADGTVHTHGHDHAKEPAAGHEQAAHEDNEHAAAHRRRRTFWALFIVFVLGPCEPLIPLLMVPAAAHSVGGVVLVTTTFCVLTVGMMVAIVALGYTGLKLIRLAPLERWSHALAGFAIVASGLAIKVLGL